ncbi:MAG TPA: sulfite exporter TauE/SafE family protein [Bacteroidales bacterium]|nr:sulfite exporter TauE/SafE family protein [Lentimicrobiaceae bacterium]HOI00788.1 sulfite exporter TauE/SafE family protein [Bacteroidales bacterium]
MSTPEIVALITAGLLCGFINTLAGGGSIISLSLLLILGMPATLANGTNRIAVAMQTLVATGSFRYQRVLDWRKGLALSIPAVVGSLIGAKIAVEINEDVFERAIGVIMILMLYFILQKPQRWLIGRKDLMEKPVSVWQVIIFFFIGIYTGFIHIGVGYFLLAAIVLGAGYDLVKANAIKVLIVLISAPFTLFVFIYYGQVDYLYGFVLGIGNVVGALVASRLAVSRGVVFVKWVIIIMILLTSIQMFGILDIKDLFSLIANKHE